MQSVERIIFNGKFLSAQPTGVHRVAEELLRASVKYLASRPDLAEAIALELWIPPNGAKKAAELGIPFKIVTPLKGIAWEQLGLPFSAGRKSAGRKTVLNLCNVGPVLHSNSLTMIHDAQVYSSPGSYSWPFRLWYRFHQPIAGWRHRRILTVSHFSKEQIVHYGVAPADRIDVIHNGVDHVLSQEPDRRILDRYGLAPRKFVVGLANTQPHKNIGILLRAFASGELDDLTLVLVGGASADGFRANGEPIAANVIFAGRVSDEELRALYGDALALCFPSLTEGFGLPPLEAMIAGCPAIVAPNGALPEVCGDAAIYADPHDPSAWVAAVRSLADDEEYRDRSGRASIVHASEFTWARAARQLLAATLRSLPGKTFAALAETVDPAPAHTERRSR